IDIIATRLSASQFESLPDKGISDDVIWIDGGDGKQALLLSKTNANGELNLRYLPITNLTQDGNGRIKFSLAPWQPALPLKLLEDPQVVIPTIDRAAWLSEWHTDVDWLRAVHRGQYSNGVIGLQEELARHPLESTSPDEPGLSEDQRLMRRFNKRQREIVEAD